MGEREDNTVSVIDGENKRVEGEGYFFVRAENADLKARLEKLEQRIGSYALAPKGE